VKNLEFAGTADDVYAGTDYRAWKFRSSKAARKEHICIVLHTDQTETIEEWEQGLQTALQRIAPKGKVSSKTIIQDKKTDTFVVEFHFGNAVLSKQKGKQKK